jgi:hypothetical protein
VVVIPVAGDVEVEEMEGAKPGAVDVTDEVEDDAEAAEVEDTTPLMVVKAVGLATSSVGEW